MKGSAAGLANRIEIQSKHNAHVLTWIYGVDDIFEFLKDKEELEHASGRCIERTTDALVTVFLYIHV